MPIRKNEFINGEIYHIYNRGIEKRQIFYDDSDHFRFIYNLYEFNRTQGVVIRNCINRRQNQKKEICIHQVYANLSSVRDKIVELMAFCLMPNHFHLVIRQLVGGGISFFMRKVGNGYAGFLNRKYKRQGHLFQGPFKAVHIENDDQFVDTMVYAHINPLSIVYPKWKENGVEDARRAIDFINQYKWSSYLDYIGISNFPSVTDREFGIKTFESGKNDLNPRSLNLKNFVEKRIMSMKFKN